MILKCLIRWEIYMKRDKTWWSKDMRWGEYKLAVWSSRTRTDLSTARNKDKYTWVEYKVKCHLTSHWADTADTCCLELKKHVGHTRIQTEEWCGGMCCLCIRSLSHAYTGSGSFLQPKPQHTCNWILQLENTQILTKHTISITTAVS